jgi:hypothetical protein
VETKQSNFGHAQFEIQENGKKKKKQNTLSTMISLFLLLAAAAGVESASPLCDAVDGQQGLQVTWSTIDSSVDWSPRFAGAAGEGNVVMVASQKHTLYRSTDDGRTFAPVALPGVPGTGVPEGHGVQFTSNAATQFYAYGRVNDSFAYWTTRDAGATWALHWPNAEKILWIEPHPLLAQVALGLAADGQQAEFAQSTYLTTDFGQTWVRIGGNTTFQTQFGCESEACPYRTAIIYQQAPTGAQWDDCRSGMCNLHRVLFDPAKPSASTLAKPTQIGDSINGLGEVHWPWYDRLAASVLFVSSRICENTDGCHSPDDYKQRVRFSLNGGISWTRALFPFDATHTMRFVTSESGVLLVGVRHHDQAAEAEYGDLYVSSTGAVEDGFFVRSLRHVYMSPKMWWENSMFAGQLAVERSSELDGVLIANRYRSLADGTADTNCLQSVITFDLGATWSLIKAPRGACSTGDCFLHVLLNSNEFPTAYSPSDAVGVWITSGMVGACLDPKAASYGTYFTSDGGANWQTMSQTPLIYEVSNHGALVVGSAIKTLTNEFTYTLDSGASFRTCTFNASTSVMVNNILTRSFNARNFLMEGRLTEATDSPGFLAHFSFDSVQQRDCTDADYEQWSPGKCLLGEHVVWSRRIPTAQCHNPTEHRVSKLETPCDCTDGDWECDFCYELGSEGKCVAQTSKVCQAIVAHPETLFCVGNATKFLLSDGYRLEPNNRCKNGVQHGKTAQCPEKGTDVNGGDNTGVVVGIVAGCTLIALVIGAGIIVYFKKRGKVAYQSMADEN